MKRPDYKKIPITDDRTYLKQGKNQITIDYEKYIKALNEYIDYLDMKKENNITHLKEATEIIQALKTYGMIHPVTGVIYPEGTHDKFIKKADKWLCKIKNNNT